jgi:hypothetical protein
MNNFRLKLAAILLDSPLNTPKGSSDNTFEPTASAGVVAADESIVIQTQMPNSRPQLGGGILLRQFATISCPLLMLLL